jgi:hypothetical protein
MESKFLIEHRKCSFMHDSLALLPGPERENDKSRSPSPPTMREYATISDATPQFQATR